MKKLISIGIIIIITVSYSCKVPENGDPILSLIERTSYFDHTLSKSLSLEYDKGNETFIYTIFEDDSLKIIHRLPFRNIANIKIAEVGEINPSLQLVFYSKKDTRFSTVVLSKDDGRIGNNPEVIEIFMGKKETISSELMLYKASFKKLLQKGLPEVDPSFIAPPHTKEKF